MAYLRHTLNGNTVSVYELADRVTIGRSPECAIRLDDPTISASHARLDKLGSEWLLTDTDSTNGLFVRGRQITDHKLNNGDLFTVGTHDFEFLVDLPTGLERTLKIKKSWIPGIYYTE
ncbi:FHA domain-containing protein [Teredinibacter turnerae]|uniref:FHA domain-containing protein n=1 Tax=Teredinibacter turnerae TaxID=2426 RepID=UPI000373CA7E|nr:FHA domain-containing protein [Teredinibacter turnerae]